MIRGINHNVLYFISNSYFERSTYECSVDRESESESPVQSRKSAIPILTRSHFLESSHWKNCWKRQQKNPKAQPCSIDHDGLGLGEPESLTSLVI